MLILSPLVGSSKHLWQKNTDDCKTTPLRCLSGIFGILFANFFLPFSLQLFHPDIPVPYVANTSSADRQKVAFHGRLTEDRASHSSLFPTKHNPLTSLSTTDQLWPYRLQVTSGLSIHACPKQQFVYPSSLFNYEGSRYHYWSLPFVIVKGPGSQFLGRWKNMLISYRN